MLQFARAFVGRGSGCVEDLGAGSVKVKWQTRDAKWRARFHVSLVCAPLKLSTNHETATM
jgi:hypothetical protein